ARVQFLLDQRTAADNQQAVQRVLRQDSQAQRDRDLGQSRMMEGRDRRTQAVSRMVESRNRQLQSVADRQSRRTRSDRSSELFCRQCHLLLSSQIKNLQEEGRPARNGLYGVDASLLKSTSVDMASAYPGVIQPCLCTSCHTVIGKWRGRAAGQGSLSVSGSALVGGTMLPGLVYLAADKVTGGFVQ
ncbi:hypothetical protein KIPB_012329, partial [Kipferlia bialata]